MASVLIRALLLLALAAVPAVAAPLDESASQMIPMEPFNGAFVVPVVLNNPALSIFSRIAAARVNDQRQNAMAHEQGFAYLGVCRPELTGGTASRHGAGGLGRCSSALIPRASMTRGG